MRIPSSPRIRYVAVFIEKIMSQFLFQAIYVIASVDKGATTSRTELGSTSGTTTIWKDAAASTLRIGLNNSKELTLEMWNNNYVNDTKIASAVLPLSNALVLGKQIPVKMDNECTVLCTVERQEEPTGRCL
jgi:hypothetical protein